VRGAVFGPESHPASFAYFLSRIRPDKAGWPIAFRDAFGINASELGRIWIWLEVIANGSPLGQFGGTPNWTGRRPVLHDSDFSRHELTAPATMASALIFPGFVFDAHCPFLLIVRI
jgi:hypothetical protein